MRNISFVISIAIALPVSIWANVMGGEPGARCGSAGRISEASAANATYKIVLTDKGGKDIGGSELTLRARDLGGGRFGARRDIDAGAFSGQVCDGHNVTTLLPTGAQGFEAAAIGNGAVADLSIESLYYDSNPGLILIEGIFARIGIVIGNEVPVNVPDLFADTNGDRVIGEGDVLYSLVDLRTFLSAPPSYNFGDTFTITNGLVSALPGMIFSTTPFSYNSALTSTVFGDLTSGGPPGFDGTPANGTAVVLAEHQIESIPEPTTFLLVLTSAAVALGRKRSAAQRPPRNVDSTQMVE